MGPDFLFTDADGVQPLFVYAMSFTGFNNSRQASGWRNPDGLDGSSYAFRFAPGVGAEYFTDPSVARGINAGGDMAGKVLRSGHTGRNHLRR